MDKRKLSSRDYLALGIGAAGLLLFALALGAGVIASFKPSPPTDSFSAYTPAPRSELLAQARTVSPEPTDAPTDSPEPSEAPAPTPKPMSAEERGRPDREIAQKYWSSTVGFMALAGAAIEFAGDAAQNGDAVTAQQFLTIAEKQANLASDASLNGAPDGWDENISPNLLSAANSYKKAIDELKDGLGTGNSETIANALDDAASAGNDMTDATHDARVWYTQHGGKWSDIEDYQTTEESVSSGLKSLVNSSNQ